MSARIYLLAGTVLAVIVAMGTVLVLSAHTTERPLVALDVAGTGPQAAVLVATRTLPAGSTISAASARSLFAAVQVPAAAAPATAFSSPDQLVGVLRFGSRRTIGTLSRGQVLLASMLSGLVYPQMGSALANALPQNTVATTLAVPPLDAVNGAIAPGDTVEVVYGVRGGTQARFLTEASLVLATSADGRGYTLALTPAQAALAALLQDQGAVLHLLLLPSRPSPSTAQSQGGGRAG